MVFYIILLLLFLLTLYYLYPLIRASYISNTKGLSPITVIKNAERYAVAAGEFLSRTNTRKGFYHIWFGPRFAVSACDPDSAEFVLKCPQIEKFQPFSSKMLNQAFGDNLIFTNGDHWRTQRVMVNPGFNTQAYQHYYPIFMECTEKLLEKFDVIKGNDIESKDWFSRFTVDLLGRSIFQYDFQTLDSSQNKLYHAYKSLMADENTLPVIFLPFLEYLPLPATKNRQNNVNIVLSHFNQIIEEHKNHKDKNSHKDILDNLLENHHQLSSHELLSNLFIFFLAGHHTTATALAFAVCELADKPHIQERLYEEIISKYGHKSPSFESVSAENTSEYLQNFLLENLRLHPPLDVIPTRIATADIPYNHQILPKNSYVTIDVRNIHRHPQYWEEPDKFDPDRFLMERKKGRHKYAFLPFSLGKRQCLGTEFSFIEQRLCLVRLLQRYRILQPKDNEPKVLSDSHPLGTCEKYWIRIEKR